MLLSQVSVMSDWDLEKFYCTQKALKLTLFWVGRYKKAWFLIAYPLLHGVSFHPSVSSFFFVCSMKGVNELVALSHKTAACTCDIISYAPIINSVNRCDVYFMYFITSSTS